MLKKGLQKALHSEGMIVVSETNLENKFPRGFSYRIEGVIYTVKDNVSKNSNEQMRLVTTSAGDTEVMLVAVIEKDLKEYGCEILSTGEIPQDKKDDKKEDTTEAPKDDTKK